MQGLPRIGLASYPLDQQIAILVNAAPALSIIPFEEGEIAGSDPGKPAFVPGIDLDEEMARKGSGEFRRVPGFETLVVKRGDLGGKPDAEFTHPASPDHGTENQPFRRQLLIRTCRMRQPATPDKRTVKIKRTGIADRYRLFRRRKHRKRLRERVHSGKEDFPGQPQRFFGLEHDCELDQLESSDIVKAAGTAIGIARRVRSGQGGLKGILTFPESKRSDQGRKPRNIVHISAFAPEKNSGGGYQPAGPPFRPLASGVTFLFEDILKKTSPAEKDRLGQQKTSRGARSARPDRSRKRMASTLPDIKTQDARMPRLVVCSCEKTFTPDLAAIATGLAIPESAITACHHLCGAEQDKLAQLGSQAAPLLLACRQEETALRTILEDAGFSGGQTFLDIRNAAGWSTEGAKSGPKMAALLAAGLLEPSALPFVTMESQGVALVYGADATAIEVASRLAATLDVTVMLRNPKGVAPPARRDFPIAKGMIRQASGHLGAFNLVVDDFALAMPSSRAALTFGEPRDQARSTCDVIIDLTGDRALFSADDLRDGYLRADPRDPLALDRLVEKARDLVGTFDKPKYITFDPGLCAHSRSTITGCTRCLEICPTGAITPAGDHVAIDPQICAGCGGCASVCPTGAASYALPSTDYLLKKIRTMLRAYHQAGGQQAILLFHDGDHGEPLIDALARFGEGLPARVIPLSVNEVTQLDLAEIAGAFAYGATGIAVLTRARPKHDIAALTKLGDTVATLLPALGYAAEAFRLVQADDPDVLLAALREMPAGAKAGTASFLPLGAKRPLTMLALREWHAIAPQQPGIVPLAKGAGFGKVEVNAEGCTLCLACVSTCPVDALSANPERPELRFQEDLCVQCGLCQATCPEKVISLVPQVDFTRINASPVSLKQEEPYPCDKCGKLFGTKSTIEKIKGKLGGRHWMFSGPNADRLKLIGYCDDCRIETATLQGFDPYAGPERPRVRTREDYFREHPEDTEKN